MYSDKIRLVKETLYRQAILFIGMLIGIIVIGFITCMKYEDGMQRFITLFTSVNVISLLSAVCLVLAIVYCFRYKYNMIKRDRFLKEGRKYPGEIKKTFEVKNWFGQGRSRNYKLVIEYDGNKEFVTLPYVPDMEYAISSNDCSVYVLNGKCYATEFNVEKKGKNISDVSRPSRVKEEDYLCSKINPDNFDRQKFIEGRVTIVLDKSDKYIMPIPIPVVFNDGVVKSVVIDIAIESPKKIALFQTFEEELKEYIKSVSKGLSSAQILEFNELVKGKLNELLRTYYYFVKIKSVYVEEI